MNIKKIIAAACGITVAATALAYSGPTKAPPGTDNISVGYGAGYGTSGDNLNVICMGTDAGMNGANNTNCVFIGADAGKGLSGKSGAVVIGDVFVHTNGVTSIKGFSGGASGILPDATNTITYGFGLATSGSSPVIEFSDDGSGFAWRFCGESWTSQELRPYNRSSTSLTGVIRFCITNGKLEVYNGSTKVGSVTLE